VTPRASAAAPEVLWHDLECGSYADDLPLWRELAAGCAGPVLDVGAGTGRVALDLARAGHAVVALDREAALLAALRERAGRLPVEVVHCDARSFDLRRRFELIIVPMQTVQLLGGAGGRASFLRCARAHLQPRGVLAIAVAGALEAFDEERDEPPLPDIREIDGVVYGSRPVAVRDEGERVAIVRIREMVDARGNRTVAEDVVRLDRLDGATLAAEADAQGLRPQRPRDIAPTDEYVGSTVVVLRG
jgi:SAM-dependent methyltransferase